MEETVPRRIRWRLLVLLWVWALCVFGIIDLFLNVPAFDHVRPEARLYRATRYAAHRMVGERCDDPEFRRVEVVMVAAVPADLELDTSGRYLYRLPGTPEGQKFLVGLLETGIRTDDATRRTAAFRSASRVFGEAGREHLAAISQDPLLKDETREEAGRWAGTTEVK